MKLGRLVAGLSLMALLAACEASTTTRLSQNIVRIDVSKARACSPSEASELVNRLSAVETIRLGYDKYFISLKDAEDNIRIVDASYETRGTWGTGSGYTSTTPFFDGTQDVELAAIMYKNNEIESVNAIDARATLGSEWQNIATKGIPNNCSP